MEHNEHEVYQEKADAQLREWQAWIEQYRSDSLPARPEQGAGSYQLKEDDHKQVIDRLENCQRIARVRLEELRTSKGERWELAKQAVERAMIDLKQALDESGAGRSKRLVKLQSNRAYVYEPFQRRG